MDPSAMFLDFSPGKADDRSGPLYGDAMSTAQIPRFFLYGEAPQHVGERYLHLESLDDRSRPADWNIRPHTHANLNHVFHIRRGGGRMVADDGEYVFEAPCLLVVPSGVVHGFSYAAETHGSVLTVSEGYFEDLVRRCDDLRAAFGAAAALSCGEVVGLDDAFERLSRELAWSAPGHRLSVDALLSTILVEILRLAHAATEAPRMVGPRAALVARFREQLEAGYRGGASIEAYAGALGVTPKQLRAACIAVAGAPPIRLIQDRLLLEAKRLMLYSNMTIAEAAFYLGFDDPAYFTRVFTKGCGVSPRQFRQASISEAV
jgi:AraC family transcriptional activator of pobA